MKNILITLAVVAVLALLAWGRFSGGGTPAGTWPGTDVACLPNGHQSLAAHVHPELSILLDGEKTPIPANIGITENCMAEIHTHDRSGTLHVEVIQASRLGQLTLADLFGVWGIAFDREGLEETIRVNGEEVAAPEDVSFNDGDAIEVRYTTSTTTPAGA